MKQCQLDLEQSKVDNKVGFQGLAKASYKRCSCPDTTVLKLKVANLSSQNLTMKRKIGQLEEKLRTAKQYEIAFNNAIRVTRLLLRKQGLSTEIANEQIAKLSDIHSIRKESSGTKREENLTTKDSYIEKLLQSTTKKRNEWQEEQKQSGIQLKTIEGRQKPQEYQFLGKLLQQDSRETIKSLDFSLESRSSLQSKLTKKEQKNTQEDFFELKNQYQQIRQSLEAVFNMKIRLLVQELQEYKRQNQELKRYLEHSRTGALEQEQKPEEEQPNRQTAFFSAYVCQTICEQSQEQSIRQNSFCSNSKLITHQRQDMIIASIKDIKEILVKAQEALKVDDFSFVQALEKVYNLHNQGKKIIVICLQEYMELLQSKKNQALSSQKCRILDKELAELKKIATRNA